MRVLGLAAASALLLLAAQARAGDPAAAQVLFDEGMRLLAAHDYPQACPKFEESQRLDPGIGTLFHYADCEEHRGRIAKAWAAFLEVASMAHVQGEVARESAAHARAAALESRLPRLAIDPGAESATPTLEILRDGAPIGRAQWTTAVPVDPGSHVIEARAEGKGTWTKTVTLAEGMRELVTVPLLVDAPAAPSADSAPLVATTSTTGAEMGAPSRGNGQRVAGVALTAAGVAGLGVGGAFGIASLVRHDEAGSHCGARGCDPTGVSLRNDARSAGDVSTIAFAGGGALLLAGIVTYVTAPRTAPFVVHDARVTLSIGPGSAVIAGTW